MVKYGDWKRVAKYISSSSQSKAIILVFRNEGVIPFSYYFDQQNNVHPIPRAPSLHHFDPRSSVLENEDSILDIILDSHNSSQPFWLITYSTGAFLGVDIGLDKLENFIRDHCSVLNEKDFVGSTVRLLQYKMQ
jgi:hypothetical protein